MGVFIAQYSTELKDFDQNKKQHSNKNPRPPGLSSFGFTGLMLKSLASGLRSKVLSPDQFSVNV